MTTRTPALLLLVAGALVLSGCVGGSDGDAQTTLSPIEQYMNAAEGTDLSDEERAAAGDAWLLENEELIAVCMNEEGFEYIPQAPTLIGFNYGKLGSPDLDTREWIERYGYGIVDSPDREDVVVTEDPNEAIVAALSPAESAAYSQALVGEAGAYDADGNYDPSKGGCMGAAQLELDDRDPTRGDEFRPLRDAVLAFYTDLLLQPEIAELDAKWAECMSEAGFGPFTMQIDALGEINGEYFFLVDSQGEAAWDDPAMAALGARELTLALADFECREKTDYRAGHAAVRTTLEERFVEDNLADLEAFKAAAEQAGSAG